MKEALGLSTPQQSFNILLPLTTVTVTCRLYLTLLVLPQPLKKLWAFKLLPCNSAAPSSLQAANDLYCSFFQLPIWNWEILQYNMAKCVLLLRSLVQAKRWARIGWTEHNVLDQPKQFLIQKIISEDYLLSIEDPWITVCDVHIYKSSQWCFCYTDVLNTYKSPTAYPPLSFPFPKITVPREKFPSTVRQSNYKTVLPFVKVPNSHDNLGTCRQSSHSFICCLLWQLWVQSLPQVVGTNGP